MKEIHVTNIPFGTLFKISFVSGLSASLLALAFIAFLHLFVSFPENQLSHAPVSMQIFMWVIYLLIGPMLSALGLSIAGWIAIKTLGRFSFMKFRFIAHANENGA